MSDPLLPGSVGTISFDSATAPDTVTIAKAPTGSRVARGNPLIRSVDGTTVVTFRTPGALDVSGIYVLTCTKGTSTSEASIEVATRLGKRLAAAWLTVWVWNGRVVAVNDRELGMTPCLSRFSDTGKGPIFAASNAVQLALAALVGAAPAALDVGIAALELAWSNATTNAAGVTTSVQVSALVQAGWSLT